DGIDGSVSAGENMEEVGPSITDFLTCSPISPIRRAISRLVFVEEQIAIGLDGIDGSVSAGENMEEVGPSVTDFLTCSPISPIRRAISRLVFVEEQIAIGLDGIDGSVIITCYELEAHGFPPGLDSNNPCGGKRVSIQSHPSLSRKHITPNIRSRFPVPQ